MDYKNYIFAYETMQKESVSGLKDFGKTAIIVFFSFYSVCAFLVMAQFVEFWSVLFKIYIIFFVFQILSQLYFIKIKDKLLKEIVLAREEKDKLLDNN